MMKRKLITGILSLSLAISGTAPAYAAAPEEEHSSHLSLFTRELTGQNVGLNRYKYVDESGNPIDFSEDSVPVGQKKRAGALPASYDARKENAVTGIKSQGITGSCWAFGAIKSLESSSIRKGISSPEETDLSENHLAWYSYHGVSDTSHPLYGDTAKTIAGYDIYDQGGNFLNAIATLANWWGAVREEDAPFTAESEQEVAAMKNKMAAADESLRTKSAVHLTNAKNYDDANLAVKKQAILDNGSMSVSLYFSERDVYVKNGEYSVYQRSHDSEYANHTVTIVGWDDNFSSFKYTPSQGRGAWLIANNYGSDWGKAGYYWVSYYDSSLCEFVTFEADRADNYDTNFGYDGAGYGSGLSVNKEDFIFSNVYTNTSGLPQKISAAAFYTLSDGQKYEVAIFRNLKSKNPVDGDYVTNCTTQGTADYNGYHTIPLKEGIIVAPGESFSVVTTFLHQNNTVYVPLEGANSDRSDLSFGSQPGQSFYYDSQTKSWTDTTSYSEPGRPVINLNNMCLKAFGKNAGQEEYEAQEKTFTPGTPSNIPGNTPPNQGGNNNPGNSGGNPGGSSSGQNTAVPVTKIKLNTGKIIIGKGEKIALSYTVSPSQTTDKLSYHSSSPSVASVNSRGVVTGKKTGTAKITLTASSGKSASVTVTVKKAPSSVKAKAGKKILKKGKTTRIKVILSKKSASYKITYQSTNKKVATINSKGVVKARKKGTVKIKVKTFNGKTCTVKIKVK